MLPQPTFTKPPKDVSPGTLEILARITGALAVLAWGFAGFQAFYQYYLASEGRTLAGADEVSVFVQRFVIAASGLTAACVISVLLAIVQYVRR